MRELLKETVPKSKGRARQAVVVTLLLSLTGFVWVLSYFLLANSHLPAGSTLSDQAAILFAAASLALFVLSFVIAILAVIGWQSLKDHIREKVEERTSARLKALDREVRGRVASGLGQMIGELSSQVDNPEATHQDRMAMAVDLCRFGYDNLRGLGEGPELTGLNNLVYYTALQGDPTAATFLLEKARILRAKGFEYNAPHLLLTYCRVILKYGIDETEIGEAAEIAAGLCLKPLKANERKEAEFYADSFQRARSRVP